MAIVQRYKVIDTKRDVAVGIKLPMVSKAGILFDLSYSTEDQAISNLKNLLLTDRGERLYEPLFGTSIRSYLFRNITADTIESLKNSILDDISFWLPYITVNTLDIQEAEQGSGKSYIIGLLIKLVVSVNNNPSGIPISIFATTNGLQIVEI